MMRPVWRRKSKPSTYGDLETLASFLSAIRGQWKRIEPCTVPSQGCLDRFLMMYGRALKSRKVKSPKASPNKAPLAPISDTSRGPRDLSVDRPISLPFGGVGAAFPVGTLIQHLKESGRQYIIQGQTQCIFSKHPKPHSLDFWLRREFAKNPDIKQAVNDVISQLVSTGLFEPGEFQCPDTGHLCKGIRIVEASRA
jgi:hypothetical protein